VKALAMVVLAVVGMASVVVGTAWGALPDGRGYEMVSPPDKNGSDTLINSTRVRVAADGSAAAFSSLTGFGDTLGNGLFGEYVSVRSTSADADPGQGWATHATFPPQAPLTLTAIFASLVPGYLGDLSPDLSEGVFFAWRPLTDVPNVADVANLYRRTDLTSPGVGNYELVTDCPGCAGPFPSFFEFLAPPRYVDATPDLRHVVFESRLALTADAPGGGTMLYEWDQGTVRFVGLLPDGSPAAGSAGGAGGAGGARYTHHVISEDGSKIFFTDQDGGSDLYMRVNGTSTVKLNAPEGGPDTGSASFADASVDGGRVFFTSNAALTPDAHGAIKLYMYDTTKPDSDPNNLTFLSVNANDPLAGTEVDGVIGASPDGSTVYFIADSQLVVGGPALSAWGVFAWHEGTVEFVSPLRIQDIPDNTYNASYQLTPKLSRVSASGDLLFGLHAPVGPTGYDQGRCTGTGCQEFYLYTLASHTLRCASCDPSEEPATADAQIAEMVSEGGAGRTSHLSHALSDDGRRAFFSTADSLVPEDVNGKSDVYEFDAQGGAVHLISSGTGTSGAYFSDATPSGDDVFFMTRNRLVGWDRDQNTDLYDARVGGGFPEPPVVLPPCSGAACRGPLGGAPAVAPSGSGGVLGQGNVSGHIRSGGRAKRCRRGKLRRRVRGRVRCVRRPHRRVHRAGVGGRVVVRSVGK